MSTYSFSLILLAGMFWILRVITAFTTNMEMDFPLKTFDLNIEIALLFFSIICLFLIYKRTIIGALLYLLSYGGYFGIQIYKMFTNSGTLDLFNIICAVIGIVIPFLIFVDVGFSRSSNKTSSKVKKTDWYYKNKDYDRQYDERADRNQYKF